MVNLSADAMKVYETLKTIGATDSEKTKSADQIMSKAKMGKGQVNGALSELMKNKVIKRIAKQKRAGYYILKEI